MAKTKLVYGSYKPLYLKGKRDKARRYVNDAGNIISVREFQARAKESHVEKTSLQEKAPITTKELLEKRLNEEKQIAKFYRVLSRLNKGESLTSAAKKEHIAPATVRALSQERQNLFSPVYNQETGRQVRGRYAVNEQEPVWFWYYDKAPNGEIVVKQGLGQFDYIERKVLGRYIAALWDLRKSGNIEGLEELAGVTIRDVNGNVYQLATAPNDVLAMMETFDNPNDLLKLLEQLYPQRVRTNAA